MNHGFHAGADIAGRSRMIESAAAPDGSGSVRVVTGAYMAPHTIQSRAKCVDRACYVDLGDLGYGLFASRDVVPGELIVELTGPLIGFDEAVAKGERECYPLQVGRGLYIDLEPPGCYGNHSCDPGAGVRVQGGRVELVALRPIARGDEIRYDYSTTMLEDHWTMPCRCRSTRCRGAVTDFDRLPDAEIRRYLGLGMVMPFVEREMRLRGVSGD